MSMLHEVKITKLKAKWGYGFRLRVACAKANLRAVKAEEKRWWTWLMILELSEFPRP